MVIKMTVFDASYKSGYKKNSPLSENLKGGCGGA